MKDFEELTKQDILENNSTQELSSLIGLNYLNTTTGSNGYPQNTNYAIIADTITELEEVAEKLESLGCSISKLELTKRDGWSFWNRSSLDFSKGHYHNYVSDQDYTVDIDCDEMDEDEIKQELFNVIVGDGSAIEDYERLSHYSNIINNLFDEIEYSEGNRRFFLDANNDYSIDYSVSDEDTGYNYDTRHYQLAIAIDEFPEQAIEDAAIEMMESYINQAINNGALHELWEHVEINHNEEENRIEARYRDEDTRYAIYLNVDSAHHLEVIDISA
jgi:hypothetical protein